MSPMRKPKQRKTPSTLRELVQDLDGRLEGGDALSDVWLPHEEWTRLVEQADEETDAPGLQVSASAGVTTYSIDYVVGLEQRLAAERAEHEALLRHRDEAREERDTRHRQLAELVGWGSLNSHEELLQVVRGYMMALDAEREQTATVDNVLSPEATRQVKEILATPGRACSLAELAADSGRRLKSADRQRRAKRAREEDELNRCHHCGVSEDEITIELVAFTNDDVLPNGVFCGGCVERLTKDPNEWNPGPTMVESMDKIDSERAKHAKRREEERASACARRLNGAEWKRAAAKARAENSVSTCNHCGATATDDAGGITLGYTGVPKGRAFCLQCVDRLRANPAEWDRHSEAPPAAKGKKGQVTLDEAVAAASPKPRPPGRATKKFPKGGTDLLEQCTQCGTKLGEHDGSKCPKAALRQGTVAIHDAQEAAV